MRSYIVKVWNEGFNRFEDICRTADLKVAQRVLKVALGAGENAYIIPIAGVVFKTATKAGY